MNKLFGAKKKEAPKAPAPTLQETSSKVSASTYIHQKYLTQLLDGR